jgi:hypothetical protein
MKTPTSKELAALAHVETIADAELTRWAAWEAVSPNDRLRAIGVAGLPRERASDPAASFTDAERAQIRMALSVHIGRMQFVIECMNGSNTTRHGYLH